MDARKAHPPVLLASASPQRKAILQELDIDFIVQPADALETTLDTPQNTVMENARRKLTAALAGATHGQAVIAADTVVWTNGKILGKPKDAAQAEHYLKLLSGNSIQAVSGMALAVCGTPHIILCAETATCTLRELSDDDIAWYIATGEPLTRAGAIGISHYGEAFVTNIEGSYSCIAGLPKPAFLAALATAPDLADAILPPNASRPPLSVPHDAVFKTIATEQTCF